MLLLLFFHPFSLLDGALDVIDLKTVLPETFDLALVLQLAHAAFLCVHLLETLVFGEFSHQLLLKFVLQAFLLGSALSLRIKTRDDGNSFHAKLVEAERTIDDKDEEIKKLVGANSK